MLWSGWKLTKQESAVEAQRSRERLDQAADRVTALLRANLAETGERLAGYPPGRLLCTPVADHEAEASSDSELWVLENFLPAARAPER